MDPVTLILSQLANIIDAYARATTAIAATQTPEQQKIAWDRFFELTAPFHKWMVSLLSKLPQ